VAQQHASVSRTGAGLAQVLARKPGGDQLDAGGQCPHLRNIAHKSHVREVGSKYRGCGGIDFAEEFRLPAVLGRSDLQPADAS
jgi:hypothetical protein